MRYEKYVINYLIKDMRWHSGRDESKDSKSFIYDDEFYYYLFYSSIGELI